MVAGPSETRQERGSFAARASAIFERYFSTHSDRPLMATREEAAAHVFLSLSQFDFLRRQGSIPQPRGRAGYVLDDVRRAYIETLRTAKTQEPETAPPEMDARQEIEQEKLEKLRVDNALRRRELAPIAVLETYAERIGAVIHSQFEALAGQVKKRIPHLRAAEVNIIRGELSKTANAIADFKVDNPRSA